jgi:hypothetical protein
MNDLSYPIGRFTRPEVFDLAFRQAAVGAIAAAPGLLRAAVAGLTDAQIDTPYRPGGWTVRQVVHHVPDSHLNAYIRTRLALTEDVPTIKTYDQERWAQLADARTAPIDASLDLLEALHERWTALLSTFSPTDFGRRMNHPEMGPIDLDTLLALYAWHGRHHAAHITTLRARNGW